MLKRGPTGMAAIAACFATMASAQDADAFERCLQVSAIAEVAMAARQSGIRKDVLLVAITRSPDPEPSYGIITRAYETIIWNDPVIKEMVVIDFAGREELACLDAAGL